MSEEYSKAPHQETGDFLKRTREKKGLSRYNVAKQAGWERIDPIVRIERGENYSIDTLLRYLKATDIYIFFSEKNKSNPAEPIDVEDMMQAIDKNGTKL